MEEFIYKDEGFRIIGCFYTVYNALGPGFLEAVYQEALEKEFIKNNIPYVREKKIDVFYSDEKLKKYYRADRR
jgi:GxxExxY protein